MDFTIGVNPIGFLWGFAIPSSEEYLHINEAMQFWKIGISIQNIGLIFMLFELRNKIFTNDTMKKIPLIWEIIGFCILLTWGFIPIFSEAQNYFLIEMNFLFNFSLSLSLPLTNRLIYKSVAKNKSDKEKNNQVRIYTGIIYYGIMSYGLFWGFRTRLAFFIGQYFSSTIGTIPLTFHQTWFLRGLLIVFLQLLVYFAYNKLFDSLKR
ncbi:MAG: hypothetical protein GY870_18575 [archaeon]|nr:hypothetical protein [archaeon]